MRPTVFFATAMLMPYLIFWGPIVDIYEPAFRRT